MCLGWRFGGMLADLGVHFGLDFGTSWAWEGEKGRTGKKVKMSTASMRDAHFRGLKGFKIGQTTTQSRILDTPLWRHNLGSHFGCNLAHFAPPKWPNFETKTKAKIDATKRDEKVAKMGAPR